MKAHRARRMGMRVKKVFVDGPSLRSAVFLKTARSHSCY